MAGLPKRFPSYELHCQRSSRTRLWITQAGFSFASQGIGFGAVRSAGPTVLLYLYTSCSFLGRNLSPGKELTYR
ncbi:uncharacterized protein DS421_11g344600 [Arachis hypogaea]|nr:uncharacterized protein DS421_11g344600 [Arachis hypogaea]